MAKHKNRRRRGLAGGPGSGPGGMCCVSHKKVRHGKIRCARFTKAACSKKRRSSKKR